MSHEAATNISDAAVEKATGRAWSEWLSILDAQGAAELTHAEIARHLADRHGVSDWWSQTITCAYEQSRGRRLKHEKPEGFQISRSKTIRASAEAAFESWSDPDVRERWLGPVSRNLVIRKATPPATLRVTWPDQTHLEVRITAKDAGRCQVVAQHGKIPGAVEAVAWKGYWAEALERLREYLER